MTCGSTVSIFIPLGTCSCVLSLMHNLFLNNKPSEVYSLKKKKYHITGVFWRSCGKDMKSRGVLVWHQLDIIVLSSPFSICFLFPPVFSCSLKLLLNYLSSPFPKLSQFSHCWSQTASVPLVKRCCPPTPGEYPLLARSTHLSSLLLFLLQGSISMGFL